MPPKKAELKSTSTDTLPSTTVIPNSASLRRLFTRLPKAVIIDLVLIWLNHPLCPIPETTDDDEDYYMDDEEESIEQKRMIYEAYRDDVNVSRKMVVEDRILGHDWRRGLNVLQIAMLDMQHLFHQPMAQKWLAAELNFANPPPKYSVQPRPMPSLRPTILVQQLRKSLNPLMQNHIYIQSHPNLDLLIIRLVLTDGGIKDDLLSPRRTFFIGIPSSSPYIFHTPVTDHLQEIIRQTLSQVFSTPRYPIVVTLTKPALTAKTLESMMTLCGANRESSVLGAWRIYAKGWVDGSPLTPDPVFEEDPQMPDERGSRETLARARFGMKPRKANALAVTEDDDDDTVTPALERVEWRIIHEYSEDSMQAAFSPSMTMRLEGVNVFHGVFDGIVEGWIDGERIPGWLTGEEGRSEGKVRDGRIEEM